MNSELRGRRSIRLKGWDYASPGWYFVTFCCQNRECIFGEIENGIMTLNDAGNILKNEWQNLQSRFNYLELDEYIIMPNHVHAILQITGRGESCIRPDFKTIKEGTNHMQLGDHKDRPYGTEAKSLGRIVQAFKSITTHSYIQVMNDYDLEPFQKRLWQRNYFEHIIRNEKELDQIRQYIHDNPATWPRDDENPEKQYPSKDKKNRMTFARVIVRGSHGNKDRGI